MTKRILLLGGTTESLEIATALAGDDRFDVTTSLAGRTIAHRLPPGRLRVGGFGGAAGLAEYLRSEGFDLVVDATHPFAATISRNAAAACAEAGVPRLHVVRPGWQARPGDRWIEVDDTEAAAAALPPMSRTAFVAIGRQELAAFAGLSGVTLILRMVEMPAEPLPVAAHTVVLARGPFAQSDEEALFQSHGVDAVVSKNSGGAATYAKIAAARALGLPVILIRRPPTPPGLRIEDTADAVAWIRDRG